MSELPQGPFRRRLSTPFIELINWVSNGPYHYIHQEQRKGGFSTGGFCRVERHAQGNKNARGYWTQQYIWRSELHSQERRTFLQGKSLLKTPFSWFLNTKINSGRDKFSAHYIIFMKSIARQEIAPGNPESFRAVRVQSGFGVDFSL